MTGKADKEAADEIIRSGKATQNEPEVLDCGKYAGMTTLEARKAILEDLEAGGYIKEIEPIKHDVGTCYRRHTNIEPMVSKQWFVKMDPLAGPAIDAVEKGNIKFVPERFKKELYELDARLSRLVHFAPALVGPQNSCLVLRRLRRNNRFKARCLHLPEMRRRKCSPGSRHA